MLESKIAHDMSDVRRCADLRLYQGYSRIFPAGATGSGIGLTSHFMSVTAIYRMNHGPWTREVAPEPLTVRSRVALLARGERSLITAAPARRRSRRPEAGRVARPADIDELRLVLSDQLDRPGECDGAGRPAGEFDPDDRLRGRRRLHPDQRHGRAGRNGHGRRRAA